MTTKLKVSLGFVLLATVVVALTIAPWRRRSDVAEPTPKPSTVQAGGTLVSSVRSEPRSFNRYFAMDNASNAVAALTHASLVRINRQTQVVEPALAERWDVSPDNLSYTLALRRGATFSDGTPFTSADVLFAFAAVYDERAGSPYAETLLVGGQKLEVTAPDANTVIVRFPSPYGPGLRILDSFPILPRHKLEAALKAGTLADAWSTAAPPAELAGLGPFVLNEYSPGERLVFTRNPHYWKRDEAGRQLPYIDRLVLDIVPDQSAEVLRLETGKSDFLFSEVRPADYAALKRQADAGGLTLTDLGVGLDTNYLWFNLDPAATPSDPRRAWLTRLEFRHALSHAIDRQAFADSVYLGAAVPVFGPVTPGNREWFSPSAPTQPHDPARARTLLAAIGLQDANGDGSIDYRGAPARFTLLTQKGNTGRERGAAVIQESLRKIGLAVDVVPLEVGALIDAFSSGKYDAIYYGTVMNDPDPSSQFELWHSSGGFHVWHPGQKTPATPWEAQIDDLIERQIASSDIAQRKALFYEVQRIFGEQLPVLCFAAPRVYVALNPRVAGATPALLQPQILWNAEALAVKPGATPR